MSARFNSMLLLWLLSGALAQPALAQNQPAGGPDNNPNDRGAEERTHEQHKDRNHNAGQAAPVTRTAPATAPTAVVPTTAPTATQKLGGPRPASTHVPVGHNDAGGSPANSNWGHNDAGANPVNQSPRPITTPQYNEPRHYDVRHVNASPRPDVRPQHWPEGRWHHGSRSGRIGWWWIVDNNWYFYNAPVYPYPTVYAPQTVIVEPAPTPVIQMAETSSDPRTQDDRQLNAFAYELSYVDLSGRAARSRLLDLQDRVAAFHQALFDHGYNAMDILRDTEDLEDRIADAVAETR